VSEHNFRITNYSVHLGERAPIQAKSATGKDVKIVVISVLTCRGDKGERITVYFYKPGSEGGVASVAHVTGEGKPFGIIYEDQANYSAYVDLLRNESPIWGYLEAGKDISEVRLYTGRWEPVGVGDEDYHSDPTR